MIVIKMDVTGVEELILVVKGLISGEIRIRGVLLNFVDCIALIYNVCCLE